MDRSGVWRLMSTAVTPLEEMSGQVDGASAEGCGKCRVRILAVETGFCAKAALGLRGGGTAPPNPTNTKVPRRK